MSDLSKERVEICKNIRSILVSSQVGLTVQELLTDYLELIGCALPYTKLGYAKVEDFLADIPDTVLLSRLASGAIVLKHVSTAETKYLEDLISKQRVSDKNDRRIRNRQRHGPVVQRNIVKKNQVFGGPPSNMPLDPKSRPFVPKPIQHHIIQCIRSSPPELNISQLPGHFFNLTGFHLQPSKCGFSTLLSLLQSMNDVVNIRRETTTHFLSVKGDAGGAASFVQRVRDNLTRTAQKLNPTTGCPQFKFMSFYRTVNGEELPLFKLGYPNLIALITALPDIFAMRYNTKPIADQPAGYVIFPTNMVQRSAPKPVPSPPIKPLLDLNSSLPPSKPSEPTQRVQEKSLEQQPLWARPNPALITNQIAEKPSDKISSLQPSHVEASRAATVPALTRAQAETTLRKIFDRFPDGFAYQSLAEVYQEAIGGAAPSVEHLEQFVDLVRLDLRPHPTESGKLWAHHPGKADSTLPPHAADLSASFTPLSTPPLYSVSEAFVKVYITQIYTPFRFYIQLIGAETTFALNTLMQRMHGLYTHDSALAYTVPPRLLQNGLPCVAVYSVDGRWHRALLKNNDDPQNLGRVRVQYVDYGTSEWLAPSKLRLIRRELLHLPAQALLCRLHGISPKTGTWTKAANAAMMRLCANFGNNDFRIFFATINEIRSDGTLAIQLTDTSTDDDVHITDELVSLGHAVCNTDAVDSGESEEEPVVVVPAVGFKPPPAATLPARGRARTAMGRASVLPTPVAVVKPRTENKPPGFADGFNAMPATLNATPGGLNGLAAGMDSLRLGPQKPAFDDDVWISSDDDDNASSDAPSCTVKTVRLPELPGGVGSVYVVRLSGVRYLLSSQVSRLIWPHLSDDCMRSELRERRLTCAHEIAARSEHPAVFEHLPATTNFETLYELERLPSLCTELGASSATRGLFERIIEASKETAPPTPTTASDSDISQMDFNLVQLQLQMLCLRRGRYIKEIAEGSMTNVDNLSDVESQIAWTKRIVTRICNSRAAAEPNDSSQDSWTTAAAADDGGAAAPRPDGKASAATPKTRGFGAAHWNDV